MRLLLTVFLLVAAWSPAHAEDATFTFLRTVKVAELNEMLSAERDEFLRSASPGREYQMPAAPTATNDVDLYTVRYLTTSPDLGNGKRLIVSGLLALPRIKEPDGIPLISYQHGTVWGSYEVPSYAFKISNPAGYAHYGAAYETRFMVALFAGNGYALMAADYLGLGDAVGSTDAYMMKQSTAQVNYDLYLDVRSYLSSKAIPVSKVFLGGWSQGGLNTTGFLELLERRGVEVQAAFTAASPNDPFVSTNGTLYHPRGNDAPWINTILALTIFSCESYMGSEGLAQATVLAEYLDDFRSIYDRKSYPTRLMGLLQAWDGKAPLDYLRPEFRDPSFFSSSAYGQCLAKNGTYRHEFKTDIKMFYGSNDEVIRVGVARLGADYQEAMVAPSSSRITPILVEGADHRLTFISAAPIAKAWMDSLP